MFVRFSNDYLEHQDIYYDPEYYDSFNIYHAETSLYCICVGKEINLIWRGEVDVALVRQVEEDVLRGDRRRPALLVAEDEVDPLVEMC